MRMRVIFLLCFACLWVSIPASASEQVTRTIFQAGGRILLFVDHQQHLVRVLLEPGLDFISFIDDLDWQNLQWIIPLPAPAINGADNLFEVPGSVPFYQDELDQLDDLTRVRFEPEIPRYCYDSFGYMGRSGNHSFAAELMAQATDYTIIPNSAPDTVLNQLRKEGYEITDADTLQLRQYVEAGLSFLAVKYHLEAQEIPGAAYYTIYGNPLVFSFEWFSDAIPLSFAGDSIIWIFDDRGYNPANIPHLIPDYRRFRQPHSIRSTGDFRYLHNNHYSSLADLEYQEQRWQLLTGGGAVTEYAGTTDVILAMQDNNRFTDLITGDYPYMTRLVMRTPDAETYPTFEAAQNQVDRSNVINLNDYVDPLVYWGCSSRTALDENEFANLPDARSRFDDLNFTVAHPADWELSTLATATGTIQVLSPEAITLDMLTAAMQGDANQPPMFVFAEHTFITDGYAGPELVHNNLLTQLDMRPKWPHRIYTRYDMNQLEQQQEHGVMYGIIANETDWADHEALYQAMLAYAQSYQYYASVEWPHTLFIESDPSIEPLISLEIPYPDDWIEHMDGEHIVITGENAELRLIPAATITPGWLQERFNLPGNLACKEFTKFQAHGKEGYIFPTTGYLAEASVTAGSFNQYENILLEMLSALPDTCNP